MGKFHKHIRRCSISGDYSAGGNYVHLIFMQKFQINMRGSGSRVFRIKIWGKIEHCFVHPVLINFSLQIMSIVHRVSICTIGTFTFYILLPTMKYTIHENFHLISSPFFFV